MKYQVFARKYRPQTFDEVIGQDVTVTTLKNSIQSQKTSQAYLFSGSRGTGKTTLMRLLAKSLNCKKRNSYEPCNECVSCKEIAMSSSLDVIEIDGASNRGIDDIRQINETVGYANAGMYKIYIIDEVHMLTKEAFNALLKTLEEPPKGVKFFFATTEPSKVLSTIISRCQRFDLKRISKEYIIEKLEKIIEDQKRVIEKEALFLIAKLSDGSLRDAESILDQILCYIQEDVKKEDIQKIFGLIPQDYFFMLDKAIVEEDFNFPFMITKKIYDFSLFLKDLTEHFRKILKEKLNPSDSIYAKTSVNYTKEQCLHIMDLLFDAMQYPQEKISIELLLLKIIKSKNRVSVQSLIKRLESLKKPSVIKETEEKEAEEKKIEEKFFEKKELKEFSSQEIPTEEEKLPFKKVEFVKIPFSMQEKKSSCKQDAILNFANVEFDGILQKK